MNFEELSKKLQKFGEDTKNEVQKLNEIRQMNSQINEKKKNIKAIYTQMGEKLFEQFETLGEIPADFQADAEIIQNFSAEIEDLQQKIRKIKGVQLCPSCNTEVLLGEKFCSNCGEKLPEIVMEETDEELPEEESFEEDGSDIVVEAEEVTEAAEETTKEEIAEAADAEEAVAAEAEEEADKEETEETAAEETETEETAVETEA